MQGFQLIQLTHWKRARRASPATVSIKSFQLIQLTHWKRDDVISQKVPTCLVFPTNPINALEARLETRVSAALRHQFPTNPINALEASGNIGLIVRLGSSSFQLIQLTHWKRDLKREYQRRYGISFQLIQLTHWKRVRWESCYFATFECFQLIQLTHWKRVGLKSPKLTKALVSN